MCTCMCKKVAATNDSKYPPAPHLSVAHSHVLAFLLFIALPLRLPASTSCTAPSCQVRRAPRRSLPSNRKDVWKGGRWKERCCVRVVGQQPPLRAPIHVYTTYIQVGSSYHDGAFQILSLSFYLSLTHPLCLSFSLLKMPLFSF